MIVLKSAREIALMRSAGDVVAEAHAALRQIAAPGVPTIELDRAAAEVFRKHEAIPLFKGVRQGRNKPPFPGVVCASINEQVVHGIPNDRCLKDGDILSIDTGCRLSGWCGDAATTLPIGKISPEARQLLQVTADVLDLAVEQMGRQRKWSAVAKKMEEYVHAHGFSLVEDFVGHGIGRDMHEEPQVPNFVSRKLLRHDFWLEEGLVVAIEPMVNLGKKEVRVMPDSWTVVTKDGSLSAHFEYTVAITASGPEILSRAG